jgi:outer membrane protein
MNYKTIVFISIALVALGISIWTKLITPKIGYVNSYQLIERYEGVKEAQGLYQNKVREWQQKADSIRSKLEYELQLYQQDSMKLLMKEKNNLKRLIQNDKMLYQEYEQKINQLSSSEGQNLTEGIVNQINRYVEKYGKAHGYDIILGTGETGTIIYGNDAINITNKVLEGLNKEYKGK